METLQYSAHTPAFTASLAQSAMPDAPVIPEEAGAHHAGLILRVRVAVSSGLLWAAKAVAPSGAPAAMATLRALG
ncbi:hypothetical protein [Pseudarthrobacter sp. CCNWLW207]|uniref:hypothetical protein n=1 Tax=Pseudarthrobacter sp. CCNWLW207 TaxID=3127468 RepID=UPI003077C1A4